MEYNNLYLFIQDSEKKPIGCGYYYIVTCGAMSHTAFRTKKALKYWLKTTGLRIGRRGKWRGTINLKGSYQEGMEMLNTDEFFIKHAGKKPYYALCNGEYSIGFIEQTDEGNILYYQNPNTDRMILDYKKTRVLLETGKNPSLIF